MVRAWHGQVKARSTTTAAKAYRLLNSLMRAAVADEVIARNPCQLKGGGSEAPRSVLSLRFKRCRPSRTRCLPTSRYLSCWPPGANCAAANCLVSRGRDVDPLRGVLLVAQTRGPKLGGGEIVKAPKTEEQDGGA